ncbi:hypothetical protein GH714_024413 [Hevea brasiliensis]|uniref:Phospholipid/glycerol acyltransferase domain-containing protein n=1 Tax=Hevea brasiliensis TaxID=3981 RepID=A0A6A6KR18_HEVBR|nr:hypothetical protein GH714_024413 [Hevea brasiliensis]
MAGFGKQFLKTLLSFFKILLSRLGLPPESNMISNSHANHSTLQKHYSLIHNSKRSFSNQTILVFDLEAALLKSSSLFPYFMLVAFEAGGLIRALILLLSYPFLCSVGKELGLKIMTFISFVGIRKSKFRAGTAVLPKFFLEDVGCEGFDLVMCCARKIGVSKLPRIMVEGFLKDYIGVEAVLARDMKEVYSVTEAERRNWRFLPRERYPKPLIFHDGRLSFRPSAFATIAMFMWLPFGFLLSIFRITVGLLLPFEMSSSILAFTGTISVISKPSQPFNSAMSRGSLYVCNHKTLLDPVYTSLTIMKPVTAVTYSVSRFNEVISPIKTVRLTRDRDRDRKLMDKILSQGDLVVCPEGTTCREPYLLRFSPLFAEIADEIVPVAIDVQISMFYGSTASGLKCLDPVFHYMNPRPIYFVKVLEKLPGSRTCMIGGKSTFEVANYVQNEIAKTLGFECTSLTRKDKYMILAGNNGII